MKTSEYYPDKEDRKRYRLELLHFFGTLVVFALFCFVVFCAVQTARDCRKQGKVPVRGLYKLECVRK